MIGYQCAKCPPSISLGSVAGGGARVIYLPIIGKAMIERVKCKRCDMEWLPRIEGRPAMCPRCKSRYWDQERPLATEQPALE